MRKGRPRKTDKFILDYLEKYRGFAVRYTELYKALNRLHGTSHEGLSNNLEYLQTKRLIYKLSGIGYVLADGGERLFLAYVIDLLWLAIEIYKDHKDIYEEAVKILWKEPK